MFLRFVLASAILLCAVEVGNCQTVLRADCGKHGKAHITYENGAIKIVPPEREQVGCEQISVANDKRTIAWAVLVDNCCTSYPIPVSLVVFRDGKKSVITPGQMVWK